MENLKLTDFLGYSFISELKFSPDKKHAAFVVSKCNTDENKYNSFIYIYDKNKKNIRQLTYVGDSKSFIWISNEDLIFPALRNSGDKKKAENGERITAYQKINIHGGEAGEFFKVPFAVNSITLIDEDKFAMVCKYDHNGIDFATLIDTEKAKAYEQIKEEKDYEVFDEIPFWRNGIGFTNKKRNRLYLYSKSENKAVPITDEYTNIITYKAQKDVIVFSANRFTDKQGSTSGVYLYHIQSQLLENLVKDDLYNIEFVDFLQDDIVFFGSDMSKYGLGQNMHFYLIQDHRISLLHEMDEHPGSIVGSDCRYGSGTQIKAYKDSVYYTVAEHTDTLLKRISRDGAVEIMIQGEGSTDGFDLCDDEILYYGMRGSKLQEIYTVKGHAETQITSLNQSIVENKKILIPQRLNIINDDTLIEGFVLKPVDYEEKKSYPAILMIHGGPRGTFGSVFFHEMQVLANEGYFVFYCNPRGSDGRGNEFADIRGKYGTIDYDDLMRFTDAVLAEYPQIDVKRLGVAGGSYGGFMTNWIIGHTNRFQCAVSQRSISNWSSKFGTTDIGYSFNADQQASTPWDKPEKMWWHSPLKYAENVKTPTLFLHSDEDYRCSLGEGIQMFTALKYFGIEARLCMFKGENHELSRSGKPKHRVRRLTEMNDWFAKHLK